MVDAAIRAAQSDQRVFGVMVELGLGDGLLDLRTLRKIGRGLVVR